MGPSLLSHREKQRHHKVKRVSCSRQEEQPLASPKSEHFRRGTYGQKKKDDNEITNFCFVYDF